MLKRVLIHFFFAVFFLFLRPSYALGNSEEYYPTYKDVQNKLVSLISHAKQRVWIVSRLMSDHRIADAVLGLQSKKVDLKFLLAPISGDPTREGQAMLTLLKEKKIDFVLEPQLRAETTTAFLIDESLVWVGALMNEQSGLNPYHVQFITKKDKLEAFRNYVMNRKLFPSEWNSLPLVYNFDKEKTDHESKEATNTLPKTLKKPL